MFTHVWIAGIDDYARFDHTAGRRAGASDLGDAVAEALAADRWARDLGATWVDTRIAPKGWPIGCRTATRGRLLWSLDRTLSLAARDPSSSVLLAFFGRGATTADGEPALCPTDVGGELDRAIPWASLRRKVERHLSDRPVEVWLGASFGGSGSSERTLTPTAARREGALRARDLVIPHLPERRSLFELLREAERRRARRPWWWPEPGMEIHATHQGFVACDIRPVDGDEILGRLVVTGANYTASASYPQATDTWWWDTTRTAPWPASFRLVKWAQPEPDPEQPAPAMPPPPLPTGGALEVFPGESFHPSNTGVLAPSGSGRVYRLGRRAGGVLASLDAYLWCRGEAPNRVQEWHTSEVDGGFVPWGPGEDLVFGAAGSAPEPRERMRIVSAQIA